MALEREIKTLAMGADIMKAAIDDIDRNIDSILKRVCEIDQRSMADCECSVKVGGLSLKLGELSDLNLQNYKKICKLESHVDKIPVNFQVSVDSLSARVYDNAKTIGDFMRRTKRELDCFDSRWEGLSRMMDDILDQNTKLKERVTALEFESARLRKEAGRPNNEEACHLCGMAMKVTSGFGLVIYHPTIIGTSRCKHEGVSFDYDGWLKIKKKELGLKFNIWDGTVENADSAEQAEIDALKVRLRDAINESQDAYHDKQELLDINKQLLYERKNADRIWKGMQDERDKWRELAEANGDMVDKYRSALNRVATGEE